MKDMNIPNAKKSKRGQNKETQSTEEKMRSLCERTIHKASSRNLFFF